MKLRTFTRITKALGCAVREVTLHSAAVNWRLTAGDLEALTYVKVGESYVDSDGIVWRRDA